MLADKKLNITQECELASQKTNHVLVGPSVQRRVSSMLWEVAISINQNTARKQVIKAACKVLIFPQGELMIKTPQISIYEKKTKMWIFKRSVDQNLLSFHFLLFICSSNHSSPHHLKKLQEVPVFCCHQVCPPICALSLC